MRLVVQQFDLQNPVWAGNAVPGQQITAQVQAPGLTNDQQLEFVMLRGAERLDSVPAAAGQNSVQWRVPNLPGNHNLTFQAVLRETASPANGHVAAVMSVTSPAVAVQGFSVQINNIDPAFVPSQEQLQVAFTITDPGNAATQGRYEVWGERYPGAEPEPVYRTNFNPAGAAAWNTWNGQANRGHLNGQFITPEFSPYRVRIIIGTSAGDVDDPYGAGQGMVACAEAQFEIKFQSVAIAKWRNLNEATANTEYQLANTLMIEPRNANGNYAATGRVPTSNPAEIARIRIPMARHSAIKDPLDQDSLDVDCKYMEKGAHTKWELDKPLYSRPELPLEFEPKLASRNPGANANGLAEPQAVGPVVLEAVAEEFYDAALYTGGGVRQNYWKNAAFKIKKGKHDAPYHTAANQPEFHYWQARLDVANDGDQDFDVATFDNTLSYLAGEKELTVYLNRRLLSRSDRNDDNEIDVHQFDYREVQGGGGAGAAATQIRLRPDLSRAGDVLWIVRADSTAKGSQKVENWDTFPPGPNCHRYYGGVRGKEPTADLSNYFRAAFSKSGKKMPIIGKANADFPFTKYVNLKPDEAKQKEQERVETTAMLAGPERGRAGVIFSPGCIAGDSYVVHAWIDREAYARSFGFIQEQPAVTGSTGRMIVWRWSRILQSYRLPDIGTNGLAPTVGGEAETPIGNPGRVYHGNGANMLVDDAAAPLAINTLYGAAAGFNEWTLPAPGGGAVAAGMDPVHAGVNLAGYRAAHRKATKKWKGFVPMAADTDIKNYFAVWDAYREKVPPGLPANRMKLVANTIAAQAVGTPTYDAGIAVQTAIRNHVPAADAALNPGVKKIPPYPSNDPDDYGSWLESKWDDATYKILDEILPRNSSPEKMYVLRWPFLHEHGAWNGFDNTAVPVVSLFSGDITNGFCRGDGQSMFRTADLDAGRNRIADTTETFPHEMGHSMNLVHFVAGNFAWKHHDVHSGDCLMSYAHRGGILRRSRCNGITRGPAGVTGPVAAGGTVEDGWPHAVPGAPFPSSTVGATAAQAGNPCIYYQKLNVLGVARNGPCAKCLLKVRGWKDDVLPFAWAHPDVF